MINTCAIILAWNHSEDTLECLQSLYDMSPAPETVIVTDNGSTDGTPEIVQNAFPLARVVSTGSNLGVAAGYNYGIRAALPLDATHILLTNNDVAFEKDALARLNDTAAAFPNSGIVMPHIRHYYDRNRLWCTGARWRRFPPGVKMLDLDAPEHSPLPNRVDFVPSCTLLLSVAALREIGCFDEHYFFYYDDWDFSARMRQAGFDIRLAADAVIYHKVSVSTQKADKPARWWQIMGQSSVNFYTKNSSRTSLGIQTAWFALRELIKRNPQRVTPYLKGVADALQHRP